MQAVGRNASRQHRLPSDAFQDSEEVNSEENQRGRYRKASEHGKEPADPPIPREEESLTKSRFSSECEETESTLGIVGHKPAVTARTTTKCEHKNVREEHD